jgi:hypothetical protein
MTGSATDKPVEKKITVCKKSLNLVEKKITVCKKSFAVVHFKLSQG